LWVAARKIRGANKRGELLLHALEKLLELPAAELQPTLDRASHLIGELFQADKVDVFLLEERSQTLVALGVSDTPMSRKQKSLGLDRLQLANGGRLVEVFETGKAWHTGHQEKDPHELTGIKQGLGVKSAIATPIEVGGVRRGVLECSSARANFFTKDDLRFLEAVARWVSAVVHRATLVEQLTRAATERGRRAAADELITVFAHDMSNHLFSLKARIELIHRRAKRAEASDYLRDAEAAARGIKALSRLTSDLLDVGRLDQGLFVLNRQPVDLVQLVDEVAQAASVPRNEVQRRGPEELVLLADPSRLRQALSNLITNALKHSPAEVPVVVEVSRQKRKDGPWAVVTVSDQGPGVPPHLMPRLFDRFARGSGSMGLGLGLHLAREIATAHGGTVEVLSEPGKGARFTILLPLERGENNG
jgi:signal transduction histidine kinase